MDKKKKILFDIVHPADILLFKNTIHYFLSHPDYEILILARKKDIMKELLEELNFPFILLSSKPATATPISLLNELFKRTLKTIKIIKSFQPDLLIGTSPSMGLAGKISKIPSLYFDEDDPMIKKAISFTTIPFVTKYCLPRIVPTNFFAKKQLRYPSLQELSYLHPKIFNPNPKVLEKLNLTPNDNFFILRFVSLDASHDIQETGLSLKDKKNIISLLENYGKIFISSETPLPPELLKYQLNISYLNFHSLLYFANFTVCDSQTVAAESSLLGTPALRFNSFVGRISYLNDLEKNGLAFGFELDKKGEFFDKILKLAQFNKRKLKQIFQERLKNYLQDKIELTEWIINLVNSYL